MAVGAPLSALNLSPQQRSPERAAARWRRLLLAGIPTPGARAQCAGAPGRRWHSPGFTTRALECAHTVERVRRWQLLRDARPSVFGARQLSTHLSIGCRW